MNFERIGASHPLFEASFTLYEASFPPNERRTREDHLRALQDADFFPLGAVEDGKLLADVFLWETEDFCYLEHFAVQPDLRGYGTGSTLLRQLLQREKPLILEIEPPEDELTCRRKRFYERNGLRAQPYRHVQLPFQGGGVEQVTALAEGRERILVEHFGPRIEVVARRIVPLVIMSNRNLSAQQCRAFQQYLLNRVVRYTQYRKTLDMADIIDI